MSKRDTRAVSSQARAIRLPIQVLTVRQTSVVCCSATLDGKSTKCKERSMFILFCYMKCGIQWRKIYEAVEIEGVGKFKKSFPANLLTRPITKSPTKQSCVRASEDWSEVCV